MTTDGELKTLAWRVRKLRIEGRANAWHNCPGGGRACVGYSHRGSSGYSQRGILKSSLLGGREQPGGFSKRTGTRVDRVLAGYGAAFALLLTPAGRMRTVRKLRLGYGPPVTYLCTV